MLELADERYETAEEAVAAFAALCERLDELALSREPTLAGWKPEIPESVGGPPVAEGHDGGRLARHGRARRTAPAQELGAKLDEHEVEEETREAARRRDRRLAPTGSRLFLYADTREAAEEARDVVALAPREGGDDGDVLARPLAPARGGVAARRTSPCRRREAELEAEREEVEAQDAADTAAVRLRRVGGADRPARATREAVALAERLEGEGDPDDAPLEAPARRRRRRRTTRTRSPTVSARRRRRGAAFSVEPSGEMAWEAAPQRSKWFFIVPNM